jgi:subtilisin family serine protease
MMRAGIPVDREDADVRSPRKLTDDRAQRKPTGGILRGGSLRMPPAPETYKPGELVLPTNVSRDVLAELQKRGYSIAQSRAGGAVRVILPPDAPPVADIQRDLETKFPDQKVGLNFIYKPYHSATANSSGSGTMASRDKRCSDERCYGRRLIAWHNDLGACAAGLSIGMIDTKVDRHHPTFARTNIRTIDVALKQDAPPARHWHGTGVLSVMAGAEDSSTPGLIPDAKYLAVNAFFTNSKGELETDTAHLTEALAILDKEEVRIVNMSLSGPRDDLVHNRIAEMAARGVVFVAAAGNGGPDAAAGYPAAYSEVIAVTAVDRKRGNYDNANRGAYIAVAAPGVDILTALPDGKEGMQSGTSFAAPFVTAVAAAVYDDTRLARDARPRKDVQAPKAAMLSHLFRKEELEKHNPVYGHGVIRAPTACGKQLWGSVVKPVRPGPSAAVTPAASSTWLPSVTWAALPIEVRP